MSIQQFGFTTSTGEPRPQPIKKLLSYEKIAVHIQSLGLPDDLTEKLLLKARSIPQGALRHFLENINLHISNLSKVQNGHDKQE